MACGDTSLLGPDLASRDIGSVATPASEAPETDTPPAATPPIDTDNGAPGARVGVEGVGRFNLMPLAFGTAAAPAACMQEGDRFGDWQLRYHGFGCVALERLADHTALYMAPQGAENAAATHAPLTLGPTKGSSFSMRARFETVAQTRMDGAPNPWEVAWLVWHYQDDDHFYYFIPKPNGWELGKRDPAYPGGQRFLASGSERVFPIGRVYEVSVQQRGALMTVTVDGVRIVQFRDVERPYEAGRLALYSEDAAIRVHEVSTL